MTFSKLVSKNNIILFFFSILPISFISGNAILELNIFFIIIFFLKELFLDKDYFSRILKAKFFYLLISLWFYLIINSLFALDYEVSLRRSIFFFRYILLIFAIAYFFRSEQIRNKVINIYTLILLFVSFDIFFEFIFGKNILGFESPMKNERIVSFFKDELIVGSFLASFLFIIFGKFFNENKKILSATLFTIFSISILITGERSISIKMLISIFLIIFFVLENPRIKIYTALFSVLLISLIFTNDNLNYRYKNFLTHFEKNYEKYDIYTTVLKTKYINQSLFSYELLKNNYLLGVGTKNYSPACRNLKNTSQKTIVQENAIHCYTHPHQYYYEFISEHGIIGSIIIISILISLFSNKSYSFSKKDKRRLFIFKIYFIISMLPILPTGSFFSSLQLFQFFLNYAIYLVYCEAKYLDYRKNMN